jgi:tight adherence protein B
MVTMGAVMVGIGPDDAIFAAIAAFISIGAVVAIALVLVRMRYLHAQSERPSDPSYLLRNRGETPSVETTAFDDAFAQVIVETGSTWNPTLVFLLLLFGGLIPAGIALLATDHVAAAAASGVIGLVIGVGIVFALRARRRRNALDQLPVVTDMMARAIRAGESLEQALASVSQKTGTPLGPSLRYCSRQLHFGLPAADAFRGLDRSYHLAELRMLASGLAVYRQTGGNVPMMLERLAVVMRQRLAFRRQLRAMTSSARMAAIIIAAAAPVMFFYFLFQEEYGDVLLTTEGGRFCLTVACGLEILGLAWLFGLSRRSL